MSVFESFHDQLQQQIVHTLGWQSLRPVQELAGRAILDGQNVIVLAPTAGGKTEASFFPVLSRILDEQIDGVKCIYLSPLRALLNNQEERLGTYTKMLGLSRFKWHGDIKASQKKAFIREPDDLLMITPESLEVMLVSSKVPAQKLFANLRFVIIDEIHALADCDRGGHMLSVLERIGEFTDYDFQRIGLSATVGNPEEILDWMQGSSKREKVIIHPPSQKSKKQLEIRYLDEQEIHWQATQLALNKKSLFFCDSRARAENVGKAMQHENIKTYVHHSSISREEREVAETAMEKAGSSCIVCTSTLELGIDIGELDRVFQLECPDTVSSFLQRLGRTGRRPGTSANMLFFTTSSESMLQAIALIEMARSHWVENVSFNRRSWHLLVHQLLALCLQFGSITRSKVWELLSGSSCFSQIRDHEYDGLVDHLIQNNYLFEESGLLSMGIEAEKKFGRKNFMDIYCVFSSFTSYTVFTSGGKEIGTLERQFADTIEEDYCFLLGGIAWVVERIDLDHRSIIVTKAPAGKTPRWGGFSPRFLGYDLCRKIYSISTSDDEYSYCNDSSSITLSQLRDDRSFLRLSPAPMEAEEHNVFWWTFAGGRVNNTLKNAVSCLLSCTITTSNYFLRFEANELTIEKLEELVKEIKMMGFWERPDIKSGILERLPNHRLSKFQYCLPENYQLELIANEFLDIPGTMRFLEL